MLHKVICLLLLVLNTLNVSRDLAKKKTIARRILSTTLLPSIIHCRTYLTLVANGTAEPIILCLLIFNFFFFNVSFFSVKVHLKLNISYNCGRTHNNILLEKFINGISLPI